MYSYFLTFIQIIAYFLEDSVEEDFGGSCWGGLGGGGGGGGGEAAFFASVGGLGRWVGGVLVWFSLDEVFLLDTVMLL